MEIDGKKIALYGEPDYFSVNVGNERLGICRYDSDNAIPFIILSDGIHYGTNGGSHRDIIAIMNGYESFDDFYDKNINKYDDELELKKSFWRLEDKLMTDSMHTEGRLWVSPIKDFPYHIITFWGNKDYNQLKSIKPQIDKVCNDAGVDKSMVLIGCGEDEGEWYSYPILYDEWTGNVGKMSDEQQKQKKLHMLDANEKHKQTKDFRNTRDSRIGKKLTDNQGNEMPVAKYRSMIYQESVKRMNILITEEQYRRLIKEYVDMSEVGQISFEWNFDDEEYQEWLEEAEYQNTEEALNEYIYDNVEFEIEFFDNETFHSMGSEYMSVSEMEDMFGEKVAARIIKDCREDGGGSMESSEMLQDEDFDVNNPEELNNIAKKLLRSGEYYKDCRGYILTDGTVIYTPIEHNQVSIINGIDGTFDFIRRGNIRVLQQSIDLAKEPTSAQRDVLRRVIASYADEELYLDILEQGQEISAKYINPDYRYVLGEIDRYFSEGIKPQGDNGL
jgi:hypothetical protein